MSGSNGHGGDPDEHDEPDEPDEPDELDEPDEDHAPVRPVGPPAGRSAAIYASNWKTVLAVDAVLGAVLLVAGLVAAIAWNPILGGFLGSVGLVYVMYVLKRARDWAELRREAGY